MGGARHHRRSCSLWYCTWLHYHIECVHTRKRWGKTFFLEVMFPSSFSPLSLIPVSHPVPFSSLSLPFLCSPPPSSFTPSFASYPLLKLPLPGTGPVEFTTGVRDYTVPSHDSQGDLGERPEWVSTSEYCTVHFTLSAPSSTDISPVFCILRWPFYRSWQVF